MSEPQREGDSSLFVGSAESLQSLKKWLGSFDRATLSRATDGFYVDLRELNKVLAVGMESLGALRRDEQQECRDLIGSLQRDVAIVLARGLHGFHEPTPEERQARVRLEHTLNRATPHFRWLGIRVWEKLAASTATGGDELGDAVGSTTKTKPARGKRKGRPQADDKSIRKEAQLAADWDRARKAGVAKIDFARDRDLKLKDFNNLLDRVRKRKSRSDK